MLCKIMRRQVYTASSKKALGESRMWIDPYAYADSSIWGKVTHYMKNKTALSDFQRSGTFKVKKFPAEALTLHNNLQKLLQERSYRGLQQYVTEDITKRIKAQVKDNEPLEFKLEVAKDVKIIQARSHTDNPMKLKATERWFQLVCQFSSQQQGKKAYHLMEKIDKGKSFKFIKLFL